MKTIILACIGFLLFSCASRPQQSKYSDDDIISKNQVDKNEDLLIQIFQILLIQDIPDNMVLE